MKFDQIPTEPVTDDRLQAMANAVCHQLPDHCGFFLVVVPFGQGDNVRASYVSNCRREDAVASLKTILFRMGMEPESWMENLR